MLAAIQAQIAAILAADSVLAGPGISVVLVDKGDALQVAEEAVAAAGTAILVAPPSMRCNPQADCGPLSTEGGCQAVVQVVETPLVARAQNVPSAVALAERIAWLLHAANHPGRDADTIPLGVTDIRPVRDPDFFVIEIVCAASGAIDAPEDAAP